MNVALVNPIAATPAYTTRDFIFRPTLPGLAADTGQLRETNLVELGSELSKRGHRVTVFFGDHPTTMQRIGMAVAFRKVARAGS